MAADGSALPMPRSVMAVPLVPDCGMIFRFGTYSPIAVKSVAPIASRAEDENAETATGMPCNPSSRFCAVTTMTSSAPAAEPEPAAPCAAATADIATGAHSEAMIRPGTRLMNRCFIFYSPRKKSCNWISSSGGRCNELSRIMRIEIHRTYPRQLKCHGHAFVSRPVEWIAFEAKVFRRHAIDEFAPNIVRQPDLAA